MPSRMLYLSAHGDAFTYSALLPGTPTRPSDILPFHHNSPNPTHLHAPSVYAPPQERNALESMRQDFEAELQAARSEVAKAQDALAASEDRIRAAEAVDRARLESEWQAKLAGVQEENQRLREELVYRTQVSQVRFTRRGWGG